MYKFFLFLTELRHAVRWQRSSAINYTIKYVQYFWKKNVNGGEERRDATKKRKEKGSPGGCNWREEQVWGKQGKEVLEGEKVDGKGKGKESMGKNKVQEKVSLTKALFFIGDIIIVEN